MAELNPVKLTAQQEANLKNLDAEIAHAQSQIDKARNAGIDVSAAQTQLNRAVQLRDTLLREFGSGS